MSESLAIDLHDVTKFYRGGTCALAGVAMRVRRGEIFGLLGPNGAGKSTLVKIMMTVVRPTKAEGRILDRPIGHKPTLARIGYLPESHRFPRYLTARQVLEFFGALSKVDRPTRKRRAGELLETVGMKEWADQKVATYSKGMMQRIGLAQALIADPDLVVLDEPTDGVDPVGRRDIRQVLGRLREEGKTVFVNSHLLSELEMICDRIAILVRGKVARQGTLDELTIAKQRYEVEMMPNGKPPTLAELAEKIAITAKDDRSGTLPAGQWVELADHTLRIGTVDPADVQTIIDALRAQGRTIRRLESVRPSLEDLFIEAVSDRRGKP